jgi:RND family efflux transporter MFP subunit
MIPKFLLKWIVILGVGAVAVWGVARGLQAPAHEAKAETEESKTDKDEEHGEEARPVQFVRDAGGNALLTVNAETQQRMGLEVQPVEAARHQPSVKAYGCLEQDPEASFTLRAPVAGFLELTRDASWPKLGDRLAADAVVGSVRPRLSIAEHYDLTARLMQARAEVDEFKAELGAAKSSYESKKKLNEKEKVVTDRAVEEAEAKVKSGEARLQAAVQTAKLLEDALTTGRNPSGSVPLAAGLAGDVVGVLAQPGEVVEPGEPLLKIADFSRLLARVEVPAIGAAPAVAASARVIVLGCDDSVLPAQVMASAPLVNAATQSRAYLLSVKPPKQGIRPGTAVTAYLNLPGGPIDGVVVPRAAVIRYAGSAWAYVERGEDRFLRTMVEVNEPVDEGWFVRSGIVAGDQVVVVAAGSLLSEELRAQIEAEEAGGE